MQNSHCLHTTETNSVPYNVQLHKAVQWARYCSLRLWIRCNVCRRDNLRASERTSDKETRGGGIRRRCHDFYDGTSRYSNNRGPPTDLRKGKGCSFEHRKSKAMAAGSWDIPMDMMDFPYYQEITILAFIFTNTVARSQNVTWSRAIEEAKALAKDAYGRELCLKQRVQYVHNFSLSTKHRFPRHRRSTSDNS